MALIPASASGFKGYWQILSRVKILSIVILIGVAGCQYLYWKRPKVALECPATNIQFQDYFPLVKESFFKILTFPIGSVSDSFSSKCILPIQEKICGHHGFQENFSLSGEFGPICPVKYICCPIIFPC